MFTRSKSVLSFGAGVLAVVALMLAAPRAAHAIASTLVQVTNTPANPAITQSVGQQASQLVNLLAIGPSGTRFSLVSPGGLVTSGYTVPANQSLVITAVDVTPSGCGTTPVVLDPGNGGGVMTWFASGPNTAHFGYPSGIAIAPGSSPVALLDTGCSVFMNLQGYLTSN